MGRGIDLTPQGLRTPGVLQDYTVLRAQPWAPPLIARTSHVRFWCDWPFLQPQARFALGDPANPGRPHLEALDAQVDAAVADGLQVILMPYRYPVWVNHTRRHYHGKSPEWRLPDEGHGPYSAWAGFVRRAVGALRGADGVLRGRQRAEPAAVAAAGRGRARGLDDRDRRRDRAASTTCAATCLAPSISDAESDRPCMITERAPFVAALLDALDRRGFAGGDHWVWSFHNYNDAELGGDRVRRDARAARRPLARARGAPTAARSSSPPRAACGSPACAAATASSTAPERQRAEQAAMLAQALTRYERDAGRRPVHAVHGDRRPGLRLRAARGGRAGRPAFDAWVA